MEKKVKLLNIKFGIKKNTTKLFCNKNYKHSPMQDQELDIILAPEFYYVRKFTIQVKTTKEAKKFLPSLFDEFLPQGEFEFYCIKLDENSYLAFAYENLKILDFLKKANFNISKIASIRFAQTEYLDFQDKLLVHENKNYSYENGILLSLPFNLSQKQELNLEKATQNIELSKHKIDFKFYNTVIDKKVIISISVIFIIISLVNFAKSYNTNSQISYFEQEKEKIKQEYSLPQTTFQMNSILGSLEQKSKEQLSKSKLINHILKFKKVKKDAILKGFDLRKKSLKITFEGENLKAIENYIKKEYPKSNFSYSNRLLTGDISYE